MKESKEERKHQPSCKKTRAPVRLPHTIHDKQSTTM